jgi:hypothetical protein
MCYNLITKLITTKHSIKFYDLNNYLGGNIKIIKQYNHIDKYGFEDEYIRYIEFYINETKILGYFYDMSSYDPLEKPYATFKIIE